MPTPFASTLSVIHKSRKSRPRTETGAELPQDIAADADSCKEEDHRMGSLAGSSVNKNKTDRKRRMIDPTTCERDYSGEEIEFMKALDDYKRASGRMFPTCSEILEVLHRLGYTKSREVRSSNHAC